jgi:glycosyltransferase involved in cell wall biosynthesis
MIPNGFELNRSVDETARVQIRQSLGIPLDAPVIGRIGRFHPAKDYKTFFQAAAVLNRSHPETHFVLCGREVTLDNRHVNQLLEQHAVENLHLLGERSDVSNLLPAMDMVCSSSATESFPTVLGEAMAAGIPCVATDVGDSTQIIGDTGLITPPRNVSALAQALQRMVQMPASERTALGQQARARISQHYSLSAVSDRYHRLYQSVYEAA